MKGYCPNINYRITKLSLLKERSYYIAYSIRRQKKT